MLVSDFDFKLPEEAIAQFPPKQRRDSRLLVVNPQTAEFTDGQFAEFETLLNPGDLLILNDTKVVPARLRGRKDSGGEIEILLERLLEEREFLAQVRSSKSLQTGRHVYLSDNSRLVVIGRQAEFYRLATVDDTSALSLFQRLGHTPLPPYIERADQSLDQQRYQTVYAQRDGAVAAPTAGLHLDNALLTQLPKHGVEMAYVTLHVGAGTFSPIRAEKVKSHRLHSEWMQVSDDVAQKIRDCQQRGGRIVAIGTTTARALESCIDDGGKPGSYCGDTRIFIYPGYSFQVVDALLTNFHLPRSSLLMMVCAFGGHDNIMAAYRHAIQADYRFYSYGDAMFIENRL